MAKRDPEVKPGLGAPLAALCLRVGVGVALAAATAGGCGRRTEVLGVLAADAAAPPFTAPRFQPPTLVAALSDVDFIDEDPTFTGDLLELYFMSTRAGTKDLWTSRRGSAADPWGAPSAVPELNSAGSDWSPAVSLDGLTIWFATDRGGGSGQIWQATRAARGAVWSAPAPVAELASASVNFAPAVDATETTMYFSSDRANLAGTSGGANFDLYATTRANAAASWGPPQPIPGVASASDEYDPFVAQGGLVIFFTSMRSGAGDIYWSARQSIAEPFAPPTLLTDIDSAAYDSDSTLSPDLGYMMFSSTRSGNAEIYETHAIP